MIIGFMFVSDYWFCHHIIDLLVDDYFLVTLQRRKNSLPLSFRVSFITVLIFSGFHNFSNYFMIFLHFQYKQY